MQYGESIAQNRQSNTIVWDVFIQHFLKVSGGQKKSALVMQI